MFKNLFFKNSEDDQIEKKNEYENIDPIIEQRRQEKFSKPFIYDEEEEEKEVKKEIKKETPKKEKKEIKKQTTPYQMSQVISPTMGIKKRQIEKKPLKEKKLVKKRKIEDQLIPVISPFNGPKGYFEEEPPKEAKITKAKRKNKKIKDESVEENLRDIANIIEEEKDQLKIIEERTGEFKLDFSDSKDTFIDEIDDNMSLDELMSLYEKKFKD